jgi:dihydroorotate dehydrogenase electron transfer subunit
MRFEPLPMTHPPGGVCYADQAQFVTAEIVDLQQTAMDTYRLRMRAAAIAKVIAPGQFVMVRLPGLTDVLLGRPLAMSDIHDGPIQDGYRNPRELLDVVFVAKGRFTTRARQFLPGMSVEVWGPLGNPFPSVSVDHLLLVAGGIGQTPFLSVMRERLGKQSYGPAGRIAPTAKKVTLCYGARNEAYFSGLADFEAAGAALRLATDDGSRGKRGLVTDVVREVLAEPDRPGLIFVCGPEPMMEAVARIAEEENIPCHVSLETPMACGIGICFTCVAKVRDGEGDGWDYRRTCIEGPIFESTQIVW